MSLGLFALLLNFIGAAAAGLSAQFGVGSGFGALVWKSSVWRKLNIVGWLMLLIGFGLQAYIEVCSRG